MKKILLLLYMKKIHIAMFGLIITLIWLAIIGYALGKDPITSPQYSDARQARFFPFYTIGRFSNDVCTGANNLMGTCVVRGECKDGGGISTGSCNTVTTQAVCCVYQLSCGATTAYNNTYFYNRGYPGPFMGGPRCSIIVEPCSEDICQLRIDFLAFSLAQPTGDGVCDTDFFSVSGGSSRVPRICGENTGSHVYVDFNGVAPITISVDTTASFTFNRNWQFKITQISCGSPFKAPSGCLQYYLDSSGVISSFNYGTTANSRLNSIGVEGSRQLASLLYGICVRMGAGQCSITWSQVSSDPFAFTITGDVGAIDPTLLGTVAVQSQTCTTDFIIIPSPQQPGTVIQNDRFCGLGFGATTSSTKPFVLYSVTNANENLDIGNRGFHLAYSQNACPVA